MQNQPPPWPPQQPPGQPPSFYTQPTQMYPGQFGPPPSPPQEPQRRRTFRQWFGAQTRFAKVGLGCGSLVLVGLLCLCSMAAYGSTLPQSKSAPPPTRSVANNNASQTATLSMTPTDTSMLTPTPTVTPTATPSPTPTPTPTPRPTPQPVKPTPTPISRLGLTFTCAQAVDYSYGRVCVRTTPGAALTITVTYCSGYKATSASLQGTVYANGSGSYEWDWTPETKCRGAATADVNASWNGQSTSNADTFTVQ